MTLRWRLETKAAEARRERSATFWKVVVGGISSAVLTTILVSRLLDRPEDLDREPSVTEISAAQIPTPTAAPVTRIQTPVPSNATIASAPAVTVVVTESIPAAPMSVPEGATSPVVERVVATPILAPAAPSQAGVVAEAAAAPEPPPAVVEARPPVAPPPAPVASAPPAPPAPTSPFTTDAPPWSASSWVSDPNAGAGPFTTDWNIPAYGAYWGAWGY